jgi:hypothetical protein
LDTINGLQNHGAHIPYFGYLSAQIAAFLPRCVFGGRAYGACRRCRLGGLVESPRDRRSVSRGVGPIGSEAVDRGGLRLSGGGGLLAPLGVAPRWRWRELDLLKSTLPA